MLDEIDRAIVSQLQYDGRLPFTKIAEELGITEGAVRRRVKQMIDDGKLQIVGVVEPQELGWTEASMVGITVQSDMIEEVADAIAKLPEVTYLFQAAGEFDPGIIFHMMDFEISDTREESNIEDFIDC